VVHLHWQARKILPARSDASSVSGLLFQIEIAQGLLAGIIRGKRTSELRLGRWRKRAMTAPVYVIPNGVYRQISTVRHILLQFLGISPLQMLGFCR
jgi:hypothetical protein